MGLRQDLLHGIMGEIKLDKGYETQCLTRSESSIIVTVKIVYLFGELLSI